MTQNANNSQKVYNTTIKTYNHLPQDIEHNAKLWDYDHSEGVYITNVAMRSAVKYAFAAVASYASYSYLGSDVFSGHSSDPLMYGGTIASPFMIIQSNLPLKINDSIYSATGTDIIESFTKDVNNVLGAVLYIPNMVKSIFFGSVDSKDTKEPSKVEPQNKVSFADITKNMKVANDNDLEVCMPEEDDFSSVNLSANDDMPLSSPVAVPVADSNMSGRYYYEDAS